MSGYGRYDDLGYRPSYGWIDVRGAQHEWSVRVSVSQGRDMERDGVPVCWVYCSCPEWAARIGLSRLWMVVDRVWSWPSRL